MMDVPIRLFLTLFLFFLPACSAAAVFDVRDEDQMRRALNLSGMNNEGDIINILSDIRLAERLVYKPENHPLTINGNGFSISGNKTYRCLDIKDHKLPLSHANISIHHLTFCNGSDLSAAGLLINFRTPDNSSSITITNCTFRENKARLWEIGWGGGAYLISYNGNISMSACTFIHNASAGGAGGAKIETDGAGNILISKCSFISNTAAIWYGGGLVHAAGSGRLQFKGNVVTQNISHSRPAGGVGIWVGLNETTEASGIACNNLIFGNKGQEVSGMYVWARGGHTIYIINNTIASNLRNIGLYLRAEDPGDAIHVYNNIVWEHEYDIVKYAAAEGRIDGGFNCYGSGKSDLIHETDIHRAPEFVNGGDFHLKENSPCIDAGFSGDLTPVLDIEDNQRPQGKGIDMGAYEFTRTIF